MREALEGKRPRNLMSTGVLNSHTTKRLLTTGGHYAYLKIAEGCNKRCTYCVIPSVRGAYVSVPMEELEKEARELAAEGVKELILVAQETTVYGIDLYKKKMLPELLHPSFILLSRGNYARACSGNERRKKDLSLFGYANTAFL